jgi:hypothetical protein
MSTAEPRCRGKLTASVSAPRWSVVRFSGLEPRLIAALFSPSKWVGVEPPLLPSGWRSRLDPNARLLLAAVL